MRVHRESQKRVEFGEGLHQLCFIQTSLLRSGSTKVAAQGQGHVPWGFQLSPRTQTWQPALSTCSHVTPALQWKSPFPYVGIEFPVFKYVSSCSFPGHHWEAWLCLLCSLPSYGYTHWEDPSEPSLPQDGQSQLSQPLPIGHSQEITLGSCCPVWGWHCLPEGPYPGSRQLYSWERFHWKLLACRDRTKGETGKFFQGMLI